MTRSFRQLACRSAGRRRGTAVMLFALLLPVFIGLLALSVDTAVVAAGRAQLSTVADAAALAGAVRLASAQRLQMGTVWASDVDAAQSSAIQFAASNRVLGDPALLLRNPGNENIETADMVVGYVPRPFNSGQALMTDVGSSLFFNAVQVRASRDESHTGRIPAFFSAIWGNPGARVQVSSTAAVLGVSGFRAVDQGTNANCLPIVLDKSTYASMIRKQTLDQYTYNTATNTVSAGPDGITESKLYPVSNGYPGNWGTIKIGVSNNSTATIGAQIRYGVTPQQLATYPGGILQPDPTTGVIMFEGNPGISAGLKDDLTSIIGKPVRIPIYDPSMSGGNGNNLVYAVIAFAPARLLKVVFQGSDKHVIIQPCPPPADPTEVWGGIRNGPVPEQYRIVLIR